MRRYFMSEATPQAAVDAEAVLRATPYKQSSVYGGDGGSPFTDDLTQVCRLAGMVVRHGSRIDAITSIWELPDGSQVTGTRHGGTGGSESSFTLEKDEYINRIELRSGSEVDSLTFFTDTGNKFGPFGGSGGGDHTIVGGPINGFFGRSGSRLDAIGAYSPTTCP
jgi:hypothetical protein